MAVQTKEREPRVPMNAQGGYDPADVTPGVFRVGESDLYLHAFARHGGEPGELTIRELRRTKAGTFYTVGTPAPVVAAIEAELRRDSDERREVRVFYGDRATGRDWMEENDTVGKIGRTMGGNGPIGLKEPILLCADGDGLGGGIILADCIVRLQVAGKEVYRHPGYHLGEMTLGASAHPNWPHGVFVNGVNHANFSSELARDTWIDFIQGNRLSAEPTRAEAIAALEAKEAQIAALAKELAAARAQAAGPAPGPTDPGASEASAKSASPTPAGKTPKRGGPAR